METIFRGKVFVLGDDIDTDQIIPAQYLVYSLEDPEERRKYGQYALSGVPPERSGLPRGNIPFVVEGKHQSEFRLIVSGKNFGCGSSREHAPAALQIAGLKAVVAPSYARIFYRNSVDGGFLVPMESQADLSGDFETGDEATLDLQKESLLNHRSGRIFPLKGLGEVAQILEAGGIFSFARKTGMIGGNQHV